MQHDLSELVMSRARDSRFRAFFLGRRLQIRPRTRSRSPRASRPSPPLVRPVSARARADARARVPRRLTPRPRGAPSGTHPASRAVPIGRRAPPDLGRFSPRSGLPHDAPVRALEPRREHGLAPRRRRTAPPAARARRRRLGVDADGQAVLGVVPHRPAGVQEAPRARRRSRRERRRRRALPPPDAVPAPRQRGRPDARPHAEVGRRPRRVRATAAPRASPQDDHRRRRLLEGEDIHRRREKEYERRLRARRRRDLPARRRSPRRYSHRHSYCHHRIAPRVFEEVRASCEGYYP